MPSVNFVSAQQAMIDHLYDKMVAVESRIDDYRGKLNRPAPVKEPEPEEEEPPKSRMSITEQIAFCKTNKTDIWTTYIRQRPSSVYVELRTEEHAGMGESKPLDAGRNDASSGGDIDEVIKLDESIWTAPLVIACDIGALVCPLPPPSFPSQ